MMAVVLFIEAQVVGGNRNVVEERDNGGGGIGELGEINVF